MMGIVKTVGLGVWASLVALGATYAAATWNSGATIEIVHSEKKLEGLEYRRPAAITVPMISDGKLQGYVVAKVVFTANAQDLHDFPIDPQPFVLDEAFRRIYTDGKVEFDHLSKYNLDDITSSIKDAVNKRLGSNLIVDVLIDQLNYVDKNSLKQAANAPVSN
jgi:hypothetical protein